MIIALYLLVGLSALMDLALGAWASVSWSSYVSTWRLADVCLTGDPRLLGLVLGLALLFFAALQGLALYWIRKEKEQGHWILIAFGCYLIVSSLITFLGFRHRPEFLLVDGLRGALLLVVTAVVLRSPATVRELRLPAGSKPETRRGERMREMRRGHERRRRGRGEERRASGRSEPLSVRANRRAAERAPADRRASHGRRDRRKSSSRGSNAPEDRSETESPDQIWSRRTELRARSPEELIAAEPVLINRPHRGEPQEHPLTIVVKGGTGDFRARSFMDEEDAPERARTEPGTGGEPERSGDRRRRRRRHRSRSTDLERNDPGSSEELLSRGVTPGEEGRTEGAPGDFEREEPASRTGPPSPIEGSSEVVEALDMLSLLDPASRRSSPASGEYGRHQRRVSAVRAAAQVSASAADPSTRGRGETREPAHRSSQGSASHKRADDRSSDREDSA